MNTDKIAIIGLGYVGLPLAIEFGKKYIVTAYDIDRKRVNSLKKGKDLTLQIDNKEFSKSKDIRFTNNINDLDNNDIFIVTVPTPINKKNLPDLSALKKASTQIGKCLRKGNIVVFESTVYPGATEEVCVPILEKHSKLQFNKDFFCGYSPERINPGDKKHTLKKIKKVVSGSNNKTLLKLDKLYSSIITAGTYRAPSIRVAEAAKVIENTQRDINIALMNELSLIFKQMNIDTLEVLKAAETKWNFLPFKPGLVGGHCIGVDPYYLTYKAQELGYDPKIILSGRNLNNQMPYKVIENIKELMKDRKIPLRDSKALVMGVTFKEDCPDIRNSKVIDLIKDLEKSKVKVDCYDPWVDVSEFKRFYNLDLKKTLKRNHYDLVVIAVPHSSFMKLGIDRIKDSAKNKNVIYDIKGLFDLKNIDGRL